MFWLAVKQGVTVCSAIAALLVSILIKTLLRKIFYTKGDDAMAKMILKLINLVVEIIHTSSLELTGALLSAKAL